MLTQYPSVSTPPLLQVLPGVRRHRGFQWPRHARERHACGHALRHQPGCPAQRWLRGHGTRRQDCFHWCVSSHAGPVGGWLRLDAAAAEHSTWAVGWQAMQGCCISLHTCTRPHQPHMSAHCRPTDLGDSSSDTISTPSDLANSYFPYTTGAGAAIHSGTAAPRAWFAAGRCVCGLAGCVGARSAAAVHDGPPCCTFLVCRLVGRHQHLLRLPGAPGEGSPHTGWHHCQSCW